MKIASINTISYIKALFWLIPTTVILGVQLVRRMQVFMYEALTSENNIDLKAFNSESQYLVWFFLTLGAFEIILLMLTYRSMMSGIKKEISSVSDKFLVFSAILIGVGTLVYIKFQGY